MAFDKTRLTSQNVTPYLREARYSHPTDNLAAMVAANYFNEAWAALPKGTILQCVATQDATPAVQTYVITASSAAGVAIAVQA